MDFNEIFNKCWQWHKELMIQFDSDLDWGVAVAIFSFWFHVLYFLVGYRLTVSYLTKHENQIVFHTVKQEF